MYVKSVDFFLFFHFESAFLHIYIRFFMLTFKLSFHDEKNNSIYTLLSLLTEQKHSKCLIVTN